MQRSSANIASRMNRSATVINEVKITSPSDEPVMHPSVVARTPCRNSADAHVPSWCALSMAAKW